MKTNNLLLVLVLAIVAPASLLADPTPMPPAGQNLYVIERTIPEAGKMTGDELQGIARKSCGVLKELGPQIQWVQSYVTGNKIYCIYMAPDEAMVREHAKRGGFPADSVSKVAQVISPKTAN